MERETIYRQLARLEEYLYALECAYTTTGDPEYLTLITRNEAREDALRDKLAALDADEWETAYPRG